MDKTEQEITEASFAIDAAVDRAEAQLATVRAWSAELGAELEALLTRLREDGHLLAVIASRYH